MLLNNFVKPRDVNIFRIKKWIIYWTTKNNYKTTFGGWQITAHNIPSSVDNSLVALYTSRGMVEATKNINFEQNPTTYFILYCSTYNIQI